MNIHLDHLRQRCHFASQPQADADGLATELAQIYDAWYKCRQEITRLDLVISAHPPTREAVSVSAYVSLILFRVFRRTNS
jgi:hypothetical protein